VVILQVCIQDVPISVLAGLLTILTVVFHGFQQSFQADSRIVPLNKPQLLSYWFLSTYNSYSFSYLIRCCV